MQEVFSLCVSILLLFAADSANPPGTLLDLDVQRLIEFFRHIFAVLFPLPHTFRQKIFYLSVHRTEIVLSPGGYLVVQLCGKAERNLFFLVICHRLISCLISTGCLNLPQAGRHDFRRVLPEGSIPWQPCARHPAPPYAFHRDAPGPSPPCPRRPPQFSSGRPQWPRPAGAAAWPRQSPARRTDG